MLENFRFSEATRIGLSEAYAVYFISKEPFTADDADLFERLTGGRRKMRFLSLSADKSVSSCPHCITGKSKEQVALIRFVFIYQMCQDTGKTRPKPGSCEIKHSVV